jgi:co-chaperonin GroES (HSP10)
MDLKAGDKVLLQRNGGGEVTDGGGQPLIGRESNVLSVIG